MRLHYVDVPGGLPVIIVDQMNSEPTGLTRPDGIRFILATSETVDEVLVESVEGVRVHSTKPDQTHLSFGEAGSDEADIVDCADGNCDEGRDHDSPRPADTPPSAAEDEPCNCVLAPGEGCSHE